MTGCPEVVDCWDKDEFIIMQPMCDAITVLGSRHGVLMNPMARECRAIRYGRFTDLPKLHIRAGAVIRGKEHILPLSPKGEHFRFLDQRITPCTMSIMGIDPGSRLKLKLTFVTPFRPRDGTFSTTPVLGLRLEASRISGTFRWERKDEKDAGDCTIFVEFHGDDLSVKKSGDDALMMRFPGSRLLSRDDKRVRGKKTTDSVMHKDLLVALRGECKGKRFCKTVRLHEGEPGDSLDVAWCAYDKPVLNIRGKLWPFRYAGSFNALEDVGNWARNNPAALFDNARKVDGTVLNNNCPAAVNQLLAQTLHSWLACTWWCRDKGKDWFSVWEGSCYYHSTVDVEYTQAPFYLAVWPELLGLELGAWPAFSKDGRRTLGWRGRGTLFLSHDMGSGCTVGRQQYPHEMEVEETANYVILAFCHFKRTGSDSIIRSQARVIEKYLAFLAACDTTGDGVPDRGVANTIDDASPAVQFGREQVYLAVKALAAFRCGAEMMKLVGKTRASRTCRARAEKIRKLMNTKGWVRDHFAVLLEKSSKGVIHPWTGEKMDFEEVPGWDSPHIYTVNGIACLDMVGFSVGLDEKKIRRDLVLATERCLREYGCVHTDLRSAQLAGSANGAEAGSLLNPGWISMNMLRDIAAFYRGVDLRHLADRYWNWQVTTNTQEPKLFFETFSGNNLCFYPRGIAIWGFFDALAGRVIDKARGIDRARSAFPQIKVPRLIDASW